MIPRIFLNSFHPLVRTRKGQKAISAHSLPPFIDSSIRREPDLEHRFPSITALCRPKLAPHIHEKDIVVYITVKDKYRHQWRLVSILRVVKECKSHQEAAEWYREHECPLPSNCMIPGNRPKPFCQSGGLPNCYNCLESWDGKYRVRVKKYPSFLICKSLFTELHNPPAVLESQMYEIFDGRPPGTQNGRIISKRQYRKLMTAARVKVEG